MDGIVLVSFSRKVPTSMGPSGVSVVVGDRSSDLRGVPKFQRSEDWWATIRPTTSGVC